jgi:hypothetical protein
MLDKAAHAELQELLEEVTAIEAVLVELCANEQELRSLRSRIDELNRLLGSGGYIHQ